MLIILNGYIQHKTNLDDITNFLGCKEGAYIYDKCSQRCVCSSSGDLVNCTRLRKEITSMTQDERQRYIDAILTVSTSSKYE